MKQWLRVNYSIGKKGDIIIIDTNIKRILGEQKHIILYPKDLADKLISLINMQLASINPISRIERLLKKALVKEREGPKVSFYKVKDIEINENIIYEEPEKYIGDEEIDGVEIHYTIEKTPRVREIEYLSGKKVRERLDYLYDIKIEASYKGYKAEVYFYGGEDGSISIIIYPVPLIDANKLIDELRSLMDKYSPDALMIYAYSRGALIIRDEGMLVVNKTEARKEDVEHIVNAIKKLLESKGIKISKINVTVGKTISVPLPEDLVNKFYLHPDYIMFREHIRARIGYGSFYIDALVLDDKDASVVRIYELRGVRSPEDAEKVTEVLKSYVKYVEEMPGVEPVAAAVHEFLSSVPTAVEQVEKGENVLYPVAPLYKYKEVSGEKVDAVAWYRRGYFWREHMRHDIEGEPLPLNYSGEIVATMKVEPATSKEEAKNVVNRIKSTEKRLLYFIRAMVEGWAGPGLEAEAEAEVESEPLVAVSRIIVSNPAQAEAIAYLVSRYIDRIKRTREGILYMPKELVEKIEKMGAKVEKLAEFVPS